MCVCAAGAPAQGPVVDQGPTNYTVETRWVIETPIPDEGATRITLTLQGRAIFSDWTPQDGTSPNGSLVRQGNFGIRQLGYGSGGASQPSVIRSTEGTAIERGAWDFYDPEEGHSTVYGAAPSVWNPARQRFDYGMRGTMGLYFTDAPTGDIWEAMTPNGGFDGPNVLENIDTSRSDFQTNGMQPRNLTDPLGGPLWLSLYRVDVLTATPVIFGGDDVTVEFDGYFVAATYALNIGGSVWALGSAPHSLSQPRPHSDALVGFTFATGSVPTPGGVSVLVLAGLAGLRWRR
ncbi:MAG: hypothetical protein ACREJO_19125 [Phycisphaerales bacterium]